MDRLHRPLCDRIGIEAPILLAGMAGGPGDPELVAAVTRGGGLGVFGATGMTCDALKRAFARARVLAGDGPIGVNAQLAPPTAPTGDRERILEALRPFRRELGLPDDAPVPPAPALPEELIETAIRCGARVITTFDDPAPIAEMSRAAGAHLFAMVTTVDEARRAVAAGAHCVIAQGSEAGGHRGTFGLGTPGGPTEPARVGTMALVPQVVDAVGDLVSVVASGGIMDGRGIAAALALGAQGVSLGTVFLAATEAGISSTYRDAVARASGDQSVVTDLVTGRPARWIRNRLIDALVEANPGHLGWGTQAGLFADIRRAAADQGRADLLPMLAGQGSALSGPPRPAAEIMARLVRETEETLASLGGRL